MQSLESSVEVASNLFQNARTEYIDVLFAQRDLRDARTALIDTKTQQLTAIVNAYQALGGGVSTISTPSDFQGRYPYTHTVRPGENFWTICLLYYRSDRYAKALWAANQKTVSAPELLKVGDKITIPRFDLLDQSLVESRPAAGPPLTVRPPADEPAMPPPPPPANVPGPFGQKAAKDPHLKVAGSNKGSPASAKIEVNKP